MRIARASQAHGRIVGVCADVARTMPGVVAVGRMQTSPNYRRSISAIPLPKH
jgi:hypothetical protein